jgi:hypothetical protein
MKKKELIETLDEIENRYFDLVWYARRDKKDPTQPGWSDIERIRAENPDAAAALCGDSADWNHGFNSGCLAMVRLISGLLGTKSEASAAEAFFPNLDT